MKQTFEEFLKEQCFQINQGILDDAMPDFFENWLCELDCEDCMKWADLYGRQCYLEGKEIIINTLV